MVLYLAPCPAVFTWEIDFILPVVARVEALNGRLMEVGLPMCYRLLRLVEPRREVLVRWVVL